MFATATSPDRRIRATIDRATQVEVTFADGAYRRYDEDTLGHQLERLGTLARVAYDRAASEEHRRSLGLASDEYADHQRSPQEERRQRYEADLAAVEAGGVSPGGWLKVVSRGLLHWQVLIEPGTLRRVNEDGFLSELHSALRTAFAERELEITIIKARYYDLGIPRAWRDLLVDPERAAPSRR